MTEEYIMNWTNSIHPDRQAKMRRARELFSQMVEEGYSAVEASEMLVGKGVADVPMADELISESVGMVAAGETRRIPRHYSDIRGRIEKLALSLPSSEFLQIITGDGHNRFAIGRLSKREASDLDALLRLARTQRGRDPRVIESIHSSIESHVQNAMLDTEMMAGEEMSIDWSEDGMTALATDDIGTHRVSLKDDSCTCDRYILGGFRHLGLMCEHVVAANKASAGDDWDEMSGVRKVFSQSSNDGTRSAWCDRLRREIDISASCMDSECPFFGGDGEDFIRCGFASG